MTEVDYLLVGNGLAPLIASLFLLNRGKKIAIINPDPDFFLENSELPIDPLFPIRSYLARESTPESRLARSQAQHCFEELRPFYPGTLEMVSLDGGGHRETGKRGEFHDENAPHLRARTRVWLASPYAEESLSLNQDLIDEMYIRFSDMGLNPQILSGLTAIRRYPFSGLLNPLTEDQGIKAVQVAGGFDLDLDRYRIGLLDFVLERLGSRAVLGSVSAVDFGAEEPGRRVRVSARGKSQVFSAGKTVLFWTPQLTQVLRPLFSENAESARLLQRKVRLWERYKVLAKTWTDPQYIGAYRDLFIWAEMEGCQKDTGMVNVLRAGPIFEHEDLLRERGKATWMNRESLKEVSNLFLDRLRWPQFTIRKLETSFTFVPQPGDSQPITRGHLHILRRIDGPISEVVRRVRAFCEAEGVHA